MKTNALLFSIVFFVSLSFAGPREEIINIATSQIGKSDTDSSCPAQGCYLGNHRSWCSEFVSWVYHEAQVPFDGGQDRAWLLKDAGTIIKWFKKNEAYIDRHSTAWISFTPQPGDYVFIGRVDSNGQLKDRKHSGLVELVAKNGTLHTIEGNNHKRPVNRYEYPNYRMNVTNNGPANGIVLGFGARTL